MRRSRDLRDHRDALRRKAAEERKRQREQRVNKRKKDARQARIDRNNERLSRDHTIKARKGIDLSFLPFEDFKPKSSEPLRVCHVIESLGMGGGQTMMMELVRALNQYYGDHIVNHVVCPRPSHQRFNKVLYNSYSVQPLAMREKEFKRYLAEHDIQVVLQHRLAVSKCLKSLIPGNVKYVLMNHTFHQLAKIPNFLKCDYYVTVCNYLDGQTRWPSVIHPSRRTVILNGVENDYIAEIEPKGLEGDFKTGRCHRLVSTKFKADSLKWMEKKVAKAIPGHRHYLLGHNPEAKRICKKATTCDYIGAVARRAIKMSILKDLDVYFYETFQHEGASVAILESLACGVPVLCKNFGGNAELVRNGINGYIVKDRSDYLAKMKMLSDPDKLAELKETTVKDFEKRLHVKHTACKYIQIFESLLNA